MSHANFFKSLPESLVIIITEYSTDEDATRFLNIVENLSIETLQIIFKKKWFTKSRITKNPCAKIYEEYNRLLTDACSFSFYRSHISIFEMKKMEEHLKELKKLLKENKKVLDKELDRDCNNYETDIHYYNELLNIKKRKINCLQSNIYSCRNKEIKKNGKYIYTVYVYSPEFDSDYYSD